MLSSAAWTCNACWASNWPSNQACRKCAARRSYREVLQSPAAPSKQAAQRQGKPPAKAAGTQAPQQPRPAPDAGGDKDYKTKL